MATITDAAAQHAANAGLDLEPLVEAGDVVGTGADGNVLKADVEAYLAKEAAAEPDERAYVFEGDDATRAKIADQLRFLYRGCIYRLDARDGAVRQLVSDGLLREV